MTLVLTMMVRDEADIIAATIEHHLAEGVDRILVTDNGSSDGTRDILEEYSRVAPVTVFDDPEHRKQQHLVVTRMARLAYTEFGADWVINGDADEFVRAVDPALSLRTVFDRMPKAIGAIEVPVVNLVGPMARRGVGLHRLVHRDERSVQQLQDAGLLAHPTPNAIHVGSPDVEVAQGNHFVSVERRGDPPEALELEVLHLPWRSFAQLERKTGNAGRAYEANPELRPSPNHHGMRDWRRLKAGVLDDFIALRSLTGEDLDHGGYRLDTSLEERLVELEHRAVLPARLRACLEDTDDIPVPDAEINGMRARSRSLAALEAVLYEHASVFQREVEELHGHLGRVLADRDRIAAEAEAAAASAAERLDSLGATAAARDARLHELEAELRSSRARLERIDRHPLVRARRLLVGAAARLRRGR
ncbi:glycosyltransferase family 2 protein [Agrococcus lahaulensis]|uniref:glycosyltransferase family 2 protein n=1 Tax=Agrococcus lahaulensis TaxID=341722 RepID=UPI0006846DC5|nr:glycosyltransferase family 2 protein [Agrococcus lahaulensis]